MLDPSTKQSYRSITSFPSFEKQLITHLSNIYLITVPFLHTSHSFHLWLVADFTYCISVSFVQCSALNSDNRWVEFAETVIHCSTFILMICFHLYMFCNWPAPRYFTQLYKYLHISWKQSEYCPMGKWGNNNNDCIAHDACFHLFQLPENKRSSEVVWSVRFKEDGKPSVRMYIDLDGAIAIISRHSCL